MKKILLSLIVSMLFVSCKTAAPIAKSVAYKGMYDEQPISILIMPPINHTTNVEAKEYFHSTLNVPLANNGWYVIPPLMSMEMLKKESAYDSEMFLEAPLNKFGEVFGADLVLFTIIHKWNKSSIASRVTVEIEYIVKSTKTNQIVYKRKGTVRYDASVSTGMGFVANMVASAASTAATSYIDVARVCNSYTFKDIPAGKYSPNYNLDKNLPSDKPEFNVSLNSKY
jgi:hypothetical protein